MCEACRRATWPAILCFCTRNVLTGEVLCCFMHWWPILCTTIQNEPMSSSGPLLTPSMRAWSPAPQQAKWDSCFLVRVQEPRCHPRLESTDALKQRSRFDRSRAVSQSLLDHFSNTPVAFWNLFVIADPLLLQKWVFAPTCMVFSAHAISCPSTFKVAFGERVVLVQRVLPIPVSRPAALKAAMHSFTISSSPFLLDAKEQVSSA